jgi:glutathione synthase/RimK-type ligase-like ATP-grasp enzyme
VILLCGIPSETPLALVASALDDLGHRYVHFNQRRFASTDLELEVDGGTVGGVLRLNDYAWPLEEIQGVYVRLMDDQALPELRDEPPESPARRWSRALHATLTAWLEVAPGRIVNRCAPMASNGSKPYQSQLIRAHGFEVPETLVTNDPELVLDFRERHGRVVYKSMSGVRSIVQTLEDDDLPRLDRIRRCPTQFQQYVDGLHVRVHTIGEDVLATSIASDTTDYRYAHQNGDEAVLKAVELGDELSARCVALSKSLGLDFAGIDLKVNGADEVYCFEVNPCPAFTYYEQGAGQPIARAVARYLAGKRP